MATPGFPLLPTPPETWTGAFGKTLQSILNSAIGGKLNATGSVTLTANDTTTTLTDVRIGGSSVILFSPTTANAAGAMTNLRVTAKAKGSATLTHSNTAAVDKTFDYAVIG